MRNQIGKEEKAMVEDEVLRTLAKAEIFKD
jgi:hypothetical protein